MLLLTLTTDKIQLITSSAAPVDVHADYMDLDGTTVTPGRQNTAIASAGATTDIVAAPTGTVLRNVKELHIRNKDAAVACTVTVLFYASTVLYELHKVNLLAGDQLEYVDGIGFFVISSNYYAGTGGVTVVRAASDHANATVTPTEVTQLTVAPTGTGTFVFNYYLLYTSDVATTGVRFDLNHTGTVTHFVWNQMWVDTAATASTAVPDQDAIAAAGEVYAAFASRAKGTAGRGTTLSTDTGGADMLMRIEGMMIVTVDGNLALYHGSEVAANSTVLTGSSLILVKTA